MHKRSSSASLVVMNLPEIWGVEEDSDCESFMAFVDALTRGLSCDVVFVHSSSSGGGEYVTI